MNKIQKSAFNNFSDEIDQLKDAIKLKCELSCEFSNVILLSGEILGEDTYDRISEIGRSNGFETFADDLSIVYRHPKSGS